MTVYLTPESSNLATNLRCPFMACRVDASRTPLAFLTAH